MAHRTVNKRAAAAATRAYLERQQKEQEKKTQCVHIYTDASYSHQTGIGAIAYIAVNDSEKILMKHTSLVSKKKSYSNCTLLELLAIKEAVVSFKEKYAGDNNVTVVSDCKPVVESLSTGKRPKKQRFHAAFDILSAIPDINYVYTKGHATGSKRKTIYAKYNRQVDLMCRHKVKNELTRLTL